MKVLDFYIDAMKGNPRSVQSGFVKNMHMALEYMKEIDLTLGNCESLMLSERQILELRNFRNRINQSTLAFSSSSVWWSAKIDETFINNDAVKAEEKFDAEIDSENRLILVFRECVVEGVALGDFEVQIRLDCEPFRFYARGIENNVWEENHNYIHPHISSMEEEGDLAEFCIGNQRNLIELAIQQGRLMDACQVIQNVLNNYGPNPYCKIDYWIGFSECPNCGESTREIYYCSSCEDEVCDACSSICPECGEVVCNACSVECHDCGKTVCTGCVKTCGICGHEICSECTFIAKNSEGENVVACKSCYEESLQ